MKGPEYLGLGQFVWWMGVVEDRNDPAYLGRVKVRIFGWHPQNPSEMSTNDLPWAQVMTPTTSATKDGIGHSPNGLQKGSWVVGFFMDNTDGQYPLVMGTLPGIHKTEQVRRTGKGGAATPPARGGGTTGSGGGGGGGTTGSGATTSYGGMDRGGVPAPANYGSNSGALGGPGGGSYTTIYSASGAKFVVNSEVAGNFQGFINDLERTGYYIDPSQSGGLNVREKASGGWSEHAYGNAIDVNWNDNAVGSGGGNLPPDTAAIAARNGLTSGANWSSINDPMHFEYNPGHGIPQAGSVDQLQPGNYESPNWQDVDPDNPPIDPNDWYVDDSASQPADSGDMPRDYQDQHSTHPLGRNADGEFLTNKQEEVDRQNADREQNIPLAGSNESWAEPHSADAPGNPYPHKQVYGTESGMVVEYDDRKGAERWKFKHPNGTYTEIDAGGNIVQKAKGDQISISQGNIRQSAKGDHSMTAKGGVHIMSSSANVNIEAKGAIHQKAGTNWNIEARGALTLVATDELVLQAAAIKMVTMSGGVDIKSAADFNMEATGEVNMQSGETMALESKGVMSQRAHGDWMVKGDAEARLECGDDFSVKAGGQARLESAGDFNIKAGGDFMEQAGGDGHFNNNLSRFLTISSPNVPETPDPSGAGPGPGGAAAAKAAGEFMTERAKANAAESRDQGTGGNGTAKNAEAQPVNPNPENRDATEPPPEQERTMSPRPSSNDPQGADVPQADANSDGQAQEAPAEGGGETAGDGGDRAPPPADPNGPSADGKATWFNPTDNDGSQTPYTDSKGQTWNDGQGQGEGPNASGLPRETPGIALPDRSTMGQTFLLTDPNGNSVIVRQVDYGPGTGATSRGVVVDVNAEAASRLGYTPGNGPAGNGWNYQYLGQDPPAGYNVGDTFNSSGQQTGAGSTVVGGSGSSVAGGGYAPGYTGGGGGYSPSYSGGGGSGGGGGGFGSSFGSSFNGNGNGVVPLNYGGWNAGGVMSILSASGVVNGLGSKMSLGKSLLGSIQGVVQLLGAGEKGAAALAALNGFQTVGSAAGLIGSLPSAVSSIIGGHAGMSQAAGMLQLIDQGMRTMKAQGHSPTTAEAIVCKMGPQMCAAWGRAMAQGKGNKTPTWLKKHFDPAFGILLSQPPSISRWGQTSKPYWKGKGHTGDISLNAHLEWWNATYFRHYPSVGRSTWKMLDVIGGAFSS